MSNLIPHLSINAIIYPSSIQLSPLSKGTPKCPKSTRKCLTYGKSGKKFLQQSKRSYRYHLKHIDKTHIQPNENAKISWLSWWLLSRCLCLVSFCMNHSCLTWHYCMQNDNILCDSVILFGKYMICTHFRFPAVVSWVGRCKTKLIE